MTVLTPVLQQYQQLRALLPVIDSRVKTDYSSTTTTTTISSSSSSLPPPTCLQEISMQRDQTHFLQLQVKESCERALAMRAAGAAMREWERA